MQEEAEATGEALRAKVEEKKRGWRKKKANTAERDRITNEGQRWRKGWKAGGGRPLVGFPRDFLFFLDSRQGG